MGAGLVIALAGVGAAVALGRKKPESRPIHRGAGSLKVASLNNVASLPASVPVNPIVTNRLSTTKLSAILATGSFTYAENVAAEAEAKAKQAIEAARARAKEEYHKLDSTARARGAKAAIELYNKTCGNVPGAKQLALTGNETWDDLSNQLAAAWGSCGGAAGAGAACAAVPGGATVAPACAWLGAIVGSYLGAKLEDWVDDYIKGAWNWVEGAVSDAVDAAEDGAKAAVGYIGNLLGF